VDSVQRDLQAVGIEALVAPHVHHASGWSDQGRRERARGGEGRMSVAV